MPEQRISTETLSPGAKVDGWVVFQFANGKKPARVEYSPFYAEDRKIVFTAR